MTVVKTIETMCNSFTTFAATSLISSNITNHLAIVTQDSYYSHMPKVWLMNQTCDEILTTQLIEALPNSSLVEVQQHAAHVLKKQVKEEELAMKNKQKTETIEEEKSKFTGGTKSRGKKKKKGTKPKAKV